jgi:hypothetical protein
MKKRQFKDFFSCLNLFVGFKNALCVMKPEFLLQIDISGIKNSNQYLYCGALFNQRFFLKKCAVPFRES